MRESMYQELSLLSESMEKQVFLVCHQVTNVLYVKKIIPHVEHTELYEQLLQHPHPHMANIIDFENQEDRCVIIEEYINGTTLEYACSAQSFSLAQLQDIFVQLFDVLEHIHNLRPSIVHRDIKPANIMLEKGQVKLIDFDIARHIDVSKNKDTQIIGSVGYAAPEQYGFAQSDQRSDVYALGVLMKELLLVRDDGAIYTSVAQRCMEMDPSRRYQTIHELRQAFMKYYAEKSPQKIVLKNIARTNIPGFGSESKRKKFYIYLYYVICIAFAISLENTKGEPELSFVIQKIASFFVILLLLWVPYNVGHILEIFPYHRSRHKLVRILNGILVYFLSCFIILLVSSLLMAITNQFIKR